MKRRQTATKSAVLNSLKEADAALSHDMIQERIEAEVNRATIYRILNRFCEDGLIHRIVADDGKQYFAVCQSCKADDHKHDHLHFRCLNCDKVECLDNEIELSLPGGYRATNFNGVVSGYCAVCK